MNKSVDVVSVVGARPQFVKLAPIARAFTSSGLKHSVVHTGQHYDEKMSDSFFKEFGIPEPDVNLGIGSSSHGVQTGAMLAELDGIFEQISPKSVLVYGDTNSTAAAALSAAKMGIPVLHLEAGLRSFNRGMPEELNRIVTDHLSDVCLAPSQEAVKNLATEGLKDRTCYVGDVMVDVCYQTRDSLEETGLNGFLNSEYYLSTIHRPDNTDSAQRLESVISALAGLEHPVVLAAHPRLVAKAASFSVSLDREGIHLVDPLSYREIVAGALGSRGVITDSGGLQKEAYLLGVPCTTIRPETEWVETLDSGWNVLCNDVGLLRDVAYRDSPLHDTLKFPYGRGDASENVAQVILDFLSNN